MKNTQTHAPGPFPLHVQSNGERYVIVTAQGNHFATTHDPSAARLIAVAPELLAHLKILILGISEGVVIPSDGAAANAAREVIAKAERGGA